MANDYAATFGTKLYTGTAGAAVGSITTQIAGIDSFSGLPESSFDEFETTRIDQAGVMKEFAASLGDGGSIEAEIGFAKATINTVIGYARTLRSYKILFSDGSTYHGDGWLKAYGFNAQTGEEVLCKATIRCSGAWTFTPAA
jgi:hypothetical protein